MTFSSLPETDWLSSITAAPPPLGVTGALQCPRQESNLRPTA